MARPNYKTDIVIEKRNVGGNNFLLIEVAYEKGGMNYFSGRESRRGYYVSVMPVTIENGMESFILGKGYKALVEEAQRFNATRLDYWAAHYPKDKVEELVAKLMPEDRTEKLFRSELVGAAS